MSQILCELEIKRCGFPAQQENPTSLSLINGRTSPLRDKSRQVPKFAFNMTAEICETPRKSKKFLQIFCKALRRSADPEHLRNPGEIICRSLKAIYKSLQDIRKSSRP
jgi:hypothetical protein